MKEGWNIAVFVICLIFTIISTFSLAFMIGVCTFYTESVWGLSMILSGVEGFFGGAVILVAMFPKTLAAITDILPFKVMYSVPVGILTGTVKGASAYLSAIMMSAVWSVILAICGRVMFMVMRKKVIVNGG